MKKVWGDGGVRGDGAGPKYVEEDDLFAVVGRDVDECEEKTSQWSSNQQKWHRLRMRIKKVKNFPFPNSSNIRMPTAETNIRKVKAGIMGQVFGIRPIVQAVPTPAGDLDGADRTEKFIDHLVMDCIGLEPKAEIGIDQSLEKGFYLAMPYWRYETIARKEDVDINDLPIEQAMFLFLGDKEKVVEEIVRRYDVDLHDTVAEVNLRSIDDALDKIRSGKDKISVDLEDVIYNYPDVDFVSPERVYVPTDTGFDVQKARTVTVESFLPLDVIKRNVKAKGWDAKAVEDIESYRGTDTDKLTDTEKDMREGIDRMNNPSGLVRVWQTFGYYDIDDDGKKEKAIVTSFPDFGKVARKIHLNTMSGKYPIVKLFYELNDDRWFAHRGIPELIEDLIKEIDVQHNMKIDTQTMSNFPMILYRAGMVNPNLARVNPAQAIPVNGLNPLNDTVTAINMHNPNAEFSYEREQMILETKIQEIIGQVDFSLQSMINKRESRTLGEVELQQASAGKTFSLDSKHFINAFSEIFQMILDLWSQYGDDEYEFLYFGGGREGQSIRLTREEIQGKYRVMVRGNDQNTNPYVKIQKAQQIIAAVTNPLLVQMGIVGPMQVANGVKRFFQALDVDRWEELINMQPQPQMPDPKTAIEPKFKDLRASEKAQVLQSFGVRADIQGGSSKEQRDVIEQAAEIASRIGE